MRTETPNKTVGNGGLAGSLDVRRRAHALELSRRA
jgi:hypothetical protein